MTDLFRSEVRKLPKNLRKRLKYYRTLCEASGTKHVYLYGASRSTELDGQKEVYVGMVMDALRQQVDGQEATHSDRDRDRAHSESALAIITTPAPCAEGNEGPPVVPSSYIGTLTALRDGLPLPDDVRVFSQSDWEGGRKGDGVAAGNRRRQLEEQGTARRKGKKAGAEAGRAPQ